MTAVVNGIAVELSWSEMKHASLVGSMRRIQAIQNKRQHKFKETPDEMIWRGDIGGALGECAVAKLTHRYWTGLGALGDLKADDVYGLQVRHTFHLDGHMLIRTTDREDQPSVLAVGDGPVVYVVGWLYGGDCKRAEWWREDLDSYWIPQHALNPSMDEWII